MSRNGFATAGAALLAGLAAAALGAEQDARGGAGQARNPVAVDVASIDEIADAKALSAMEEYLAIEARRLEVRRAYFDEFAKILPGRTVARFYQLENKMDAVVRYELAETILVVANEPKASPR